MSSEKNASGSKTVPCSKKCILHFLVKLTNIALIGFALYIVIDGYGTQRFTALLFCIPALLSLYALRGDKEEKELTKRLRRAKLRQELDALKKYDT